MINLTIPGREPLTIRSVVLDFNGTVALDGSLLPEVAERLDVLSEAFGVYVLTADTFGSVRKALEGYQVGVRILESGDHTEEKAAFVRQLGARHCVAVGNGANDALMLKAAALGIAVIGGEGAAVDALLNADLVCKNIADALDLLTYPDRLKATLRR
ncbi:MAG: HAD family hydrolase [Epsilonproteobacteria bacterium]|nr:HAD family hydrolase [Campylobacterota bacterium]